MAVEFFKHLTRLSCLFALFSVALPPVQAGYVEVLDDRTVIHVTIHDWMWSEIDPVQPGSSVRANAAAVRKFSDTFAERFAAKYAEKYKADPERYGDYPWDRVEVQIEKFSGIKLENIDTDLLAIAGQMPPDIMYLNFRKSGTYIRSGFVYPLDKPGDGYLESMSEEAFDFRVNPKMLPVIKSPDTEGIPRIWALPHGGAIGSVMLYRKDIFKEAGVPFPNASWDWDDLYAACKKLRNPKTGTYAIALRKVPEESWRWMNFLMSSGSEVMPYQAETDSWKIAFDNRMAATSIDFYVKLCSEAWVDEDGRQQQGYAYREPSYVMAEAEWKKGNIAILLGTMDESIFSRSIDPDVTGIAPIPKGPTGIRSAALNSRMMAISSGIDEQAVRDAAWEFIQFYDSKEALEIKTRLLVEGGLGRFVNPKYLEMFGYEELIRLAPPGWKETFEIAMRDSQPEPYGQHSTAIYSFLDGPIKEANAMAVAGELPVDREERLDLFEELLHTAAEKARRDILGVTPPEQIRKQNRGAGIFLVVLLIVFTWACRRIAAAFLPPGQQPVSLIGEAMRKPWPYFLLLPALGTIIFWQYIPLGWGSIMAFQDYKVIGESEWTGLGNFGQVLWDAEWWASVWNALRYSSLVILLTFLPPVMLAILLQEVPRGKILFRTLFYLPAVITSLVVILLWKSFYRGDSYGLLNRVVMTLPVWAYFLVGLLILVLCVSFALRLFIQNSRFAGVAFVLVGLLASWTCIQFSFPALSQEGLSIWQMPFATLSQPIDWLGQPSTAMFACVLPMVWAGIGPGCLIYLAALKGIPDELYEAADMDGASFIDKILFIVFPVLKPLLVINFVGVFIGSWFYAEANILAMTGGEASTEVAGLHIFYKAFKHLQFGPAAAMAWILGCLLILFTMWQLRILSRLEFRTSGDTK